MLDPQRDQAEGLRRLFSRRGAHARVITVASGCNGVGATGTVVNLAGALAARGHRTLAIDENYGADNVAGSLGLRTRRDLHDVLAGDCALKDALLSGPGDITVLPAAAGVRGLARLDSAGQARLTVALARLGERFDILLIDARSGTVGGLSSLGHAVQDTVVVCSAASVAITESYALIKRLNGLTGARRYRLLLNRVDEGEARLIFNNLERVARRHLGAPLEFLGYVPRDERTRRAAGMMQPVVTAFPAAHAAAAFRRSAEAVAGWPVDREGQGSLEGFLQRLFTTRELSMEAAA
jgi:flagellar biosynthesis protein FlhG